MPQPSNVTVASPPERSALSRGDSLLQRNADLLVPYERDCGAVRISHSCAGDIALGRMHWIDRWNEMAT